MPSSTRKQPTRIVIKVRCCKLGCTLSTAGDWKNKVCWNCDSVIHFERYPKIKLTINDKDFTENKDKWHVVSEEEIDEEG